MPKRFSKVINALCAAGIALNTAMFAMNLYMDLHQFAIFNLLCAGGCWVGYFQHQGEEKDGN